MVQLIKAEGADVRLHGRVWDDAHQLATSMCTDPSYRYIHPFDDPAIWEGHSSIIQEVHTQSKVKPSVVITVVGGGGLLCGIIQGLHSVGWSDVPIIACETEGAASFHAAFLKGELVTLDAITTIAKTLGAKTVCSKALEWTKSHKVISHLVTDRMAVNAISSFVDDHKVLVEPACAAGLSLVYEKASPLMEIIKGQTNPVVLVIVCGGNMVSLDSLKTWKETV